MQFDDDQRDTVLNSRLIVEVLSKSTEAYDRGRKFAQYRQIESLQEYILVSHPSRGSKRSCANLPARAPPASCNEPVT